ncbi:MAG: DUF2207 domain-containing protein, partial [Cyanobacteriota bacterium]
MADGSVPSPRWTPRRGATSWRRSSLGRWRHGLLAVALALGMGLALAPLAPEVGGGAVHAAERRLELKLFRMEAEVARNGSVQVRETLTAQFEGSWNGLRREIPLAANVPQGRMALGLKLLSAKDPQGQPYR